MRGLRGRFRVRSCVPLIPRRIHANERATEPLCRILRPSFYNTFNTVWGRCGPDAQTYPIGWSPQERAIEIFCPEGAEGGTQVGLPGEPRQIAHHDAQASSVIQRLTVDSGPTPPCAMAGFVISNHALSARSVSVAISLPPFQYSAVGGRRRLDSVVVAVPSADRKERSW